MSNVGYLMLEEGWSYVENKRARWAKAKSFNYLTAEVTKTVRRFHQGIEGYKTTPLVPLEQLAQQLNIRGIHYI